MEKYLSNSIMSKFIKNLLRSTYLPICNTVHRGSYIIEGFTYVYETNVIKCTKTGYIGGKYKQIYSKDTPVDTYIATNANKDTYVAVDETNLLKNDIPSYLGAWTDTMADVAKYRVLRPYEFGRLYNKYTENFISNTDDYDSETHIWLGKYLRCLRDTKGIDLMPYYNLYSNDYLANYKILETEVQEYYRAPYSILKVPIKFNTEYTIALDSSSEVTICPAFFQKELPIKVTIDSETQPLTSVYLQTGNRVQTYSSSDYTSPFIFTATNTVDTTGDNCTLFQNYEKYLVLLIQVPSSVHTTVTILEGNYLNTNSEKVINMEDVWKMHNSELNEVLCSNLSLLQFGTDINIPYSNRLVEYLLWNVVTSQETFAENIEFIQDLLPDATGINSTVGVWNNYLRAKLYRFSTSQQDSKKLDLNGFLDKDTEKLLMKQVFTGYSW